LPKQKPAPFVDIETAVYDKDMLTLVNDPFAADVHFSVQGRRLYGHKIVLASASVSFYRLFLDHENARKREMLEPKSEKKVKHKKVEEPEPQEPVQEEIPEEYICPITQDIMKDPVIAQDGHTYERTNITNWLDKHGTSPITRENISKDIIISNRVLKGQIEQYLEKKGGVVKQKPQKKKKESKTKSTTLPSGFADISTVTEDGKDIIEIIMDKNILFDVFLQILEFLYTGVISQKKEIEDILLTAQLLNLDYLVTICKNMQEHSEELNPSIGTYLNDEAGARAIELFWNKPLYSDIAFRVSNSTTFFAHKSLAGARCKVLRTMFESPFAESTQSSIAINDTSKDAFGAFLKFLYSDHCPFLESEDSVGILALANEYGLTRLVTLCELFITKQVEVATTDDISKADIDIIGLLLAAQLHRAPQLANFCLHFISSNYQPMKKRAEWSKLKGENLKYIKDNQWPPKCYIAELEAYEKATGKAGEEKCVVM